MDGAREAQLRAAPARNRRAHPRFSVDEGARVLLVKHGSSVPCRIIDLSQSGCRVRTQERFVAGILVRVEVSFRVRGMDFRIYGVTQWTDGRHLAGIRFVDMTERRKAELAEALGEVETIARADAESEALKQAAAAQQAAPVGEQPVAEALPVQAAASGPSLTAVVEPVPQTKVDSTGVPAESSHHAPRAISVLPWQTASSPQPTPPLSGPLNAASQTLQNSPLPRRERRAQARHEVDTSATIFLVNVASNLPGRILDLSMSGCRIRTDERFPVGIYTRVETEFHLEGLPFRLGGVTQALRDRFNVGIRFLDMSARKREQLEQLMQEIEELHARQAAASGNQNEQSGEPSHENHG